MPFDDYKIAFTVHTEYLYVHLKAEDVSDGSISAYVSDIVAKSEETGLDKIILYRDIPVANNEASVFKTVSASLEELYGKKLAIVNPYEELNDVLKFGMTVGSNRGGNYEVFDTVEEAEKWLLS
ncbi:MAG TPA: hypothetical protein PKA82_12800 [Pyrinomonadaceae bacterium]|nr:hypothetical protein [Pyrinomonadaceae bacterium]